MKTFRIVVLAAIVLALPGFSLAQTSTTSVRGVVTDPAGAIIPGATVSIENSQVGFSSSRTAGEHGEYLFQQLQPGRYTISTSAPGFGAQTVVANLLVNQPATINFKLTVQSANVTMDVSATAETINTTDATIGNAVNNQTIKSLPMEGRNVPDLLSLQPGVLYLGRQVSQDQDSRTGSVAGARSDQTNVTLDGLDDNDQVNGYAFTGVLRSTLDSTEEFRVATTQSNADAGRSSGAQVSLVTKSGTNKFHGSLYEYNRNTMAVANDWFNKQAELGAGLPNVPGKLIRNTFGGSIGGPILKNKLFFFFNYEGQRTAENEQVTQTVPTANYRAGKLTYEYCVDPNDPNCANVGTQTMTSPQLGQLDSTCTANGVCPWGPGPDPYVEQLFQQYPMPNGTSAGDIYNLASYSFSSPHPGTLNTTILKIDFVPSDKHRIFVRGNLQKDTQAGIENFPGQPASSNLIDNTKGLAAGDTWTITPNLVNDLRYGYIRQGYGNSGIGQGDYVDFRFMSNLTAETRSEIVNVPVNNIVDNLSWIKGRHNFQFGGNWRLIYNNRTSNFNSFNGASTNPYWYAGGPPDPSTIGLPAVSSSFSNSYLIAYASLVGGVPELDNVYNYKVSGDGQTGSALGDGAFVDRHFKANEFEYYAQDTWQARPDLTITFGLRHTILQTPYETHGQQIAPTVDTHEWFLKRQAAASQGQVFEDDLQFAPNGPANHRPGYWPKQKFNIAPRIAVAYAPNNKTSIRAGFGIYYDHYGEGIVNTFDQNGSFGLTTALSNPAGVYAVDSAPRFTGRQNIPNIPLGVTPPSTVTYPYTPPDGAFLITWGVDNHLKTPYSEAMDFSIQRQLPGGFTLETSYVGRMGRHLLQSLDLAEPVNFVDTRSGVDYFTAATQLSKLVDANNGNANATVQAIPYFEDIFPQMANYDYQGESATQAIYTNEWAPYRYTAGETTSLADLDFYCAYGCPNGTLFWQSQFSSLYSLASIGTSYYNAGQVVLRHPMSHGLQLDFSYTFSKSVDMGSDAERASEISSNGSFSNIINSWKPSLNRAVSDFDARHLITVDWIYNLPFGRGKAVFSGANHFVNAVIGGWQWTGLGRWTSGLPFGVIAPGWATDWQIESWGVQTGPIKTHRHLDSNGSPQAFADPAAINRGIQNGGSPMRLPYPGEAGGRNIFRGDGYFDIDSGLAKTWAITGTQSLRFAWEVFNATNSVRFNTNPNYINSTASVVGLNNQLTQNTLGVYSATLTAPRVQQFSFRYDF